MNPIKFSFQIIIFLRLVWKFDFGKTEYLWTDNGSPYINENAVIIDWIEESVKESIQYEKTYYNLLSNSSAFACELFS